MDMITSLKTIKGLYCYLPQYRFADILAKCVHDGQKDKAGEDYWRHAFRVGTECGKIHDDKIMYENSLFATDLQVIGMLHDVVEDTSVTFDDLLYFGIEEKIVNVLRILTRRDNESYMDYIRRVGENRAATLAKIEDLNDNMNLLRLPEISDEDINRWKKYNKARKYLQEKLKESTDG